jgi:hypothetical protein
MAGPGSGRPGGPLGRRERLWGNVRVPPLAALHGAPGHPVQDFTVSTSRGTENLENWKSEVQTIGQEANFGLHIKCPHRQDSRCGKATGGGTCVNAFDLSGINGENSSVPADLKLLMGPQGPPLTS